jgi:hypothetical protein
VLLLLTLAVYVCVLAVAQSAQPGQNQDDHTDFFDSIAKTVYATAWPTATYKAWHMELPCQDKDGGVDIVVRFVGQSSMPLENELWVDIAFAFRSWKLDHYFVVNDNHVWVPPFKTAGLLSAALAQAFTDYQKSQSTQPAQSPSPSESPYQAPTTTPSEPAASTTAVAVCVENEMSDPVNYSYRWETLGWKQDHLDPGKAWVYTYNVTNAQAAGPQFYISYDDSFDSSYTVRQYTLNRSTVTLPASCDTAAQYAFTLNGRLIALTATSSPSAPAPDTTSTANSAEPASSATIAAVCIENSTNLQLYYTYSWETDGWKVEHIAPGTYVLNRFPASTGQANVPRFSIDYPDDTRDGRKMQSSILDANIVASPGDCSSAKRYIFVENGESLTLNPEN